MPRGLVHIHDTQAVPCGVAWIVRTLAIVSVVGCSAEDPFAPSRNLCPREVMRTVNEGWLREHPDLGNNRWARAVYYIGNLDAFQALGEPAYLDRTLAWAESHAWTINGGVGTRDADNFAAGQVYLALYDHEPQSVRIAEVAAVVHDVVSGGSVIAPGGGHGSVDDDWWWIDAIFMAAPVFAGVGRLADEPRAVQALAKRYMDTKARRALYDPAEGLWYRDEDHRYPGVASATGEKEFWARGNGWVIAALVRTLEQLPADGAHRGEFLTMLKGMAAALMPLQRPDGFWNVSLHDPDDHGGPETSSTALFTYAIAWGIREGHLDAGTYEPVVEAAWRGLVQFAVRGDGGLGYVQGPGASPASAQPVTIDSSADFGIGVFLLAGSQVHELGLVRGCD